MENDAVYQYSKLIAENFSVWPLLFLAAVYWVIKHPEIFRQLPNYVKTFKIGNFEIELAEVKAELAEAKQQVDELENELEREASRFSEILESFDPHAPVADLARTRAALKAMAPAMDDLAPIRKGLAPGASAEEIYAAAEVARTRRDVHLFDDLVACLDRLSADPNLLGIRLHTIWTLTSALHKTLIADIKHGQHLLSRQQLKSAQKVLVQVSENPRVQRDRADNPMRGVRGPAKWATEWVERRLTELDTTSSAEDAAVS